MVKTVIFDVDGTLLDTERIYMKAWSEAAQRRGFCIPQEALLKTRAVNAKVAKACFQEYCGEDFPYDILRIERVAIAEQIIAECDSDALLKPHVHLLLQWLADQKICIAAASSTDYKTTVAHLQHAGILKYFSVVVGGDMIAKGKPAPDIFLRAAELASSSAADCIVVGDSPADVFAAHAANIPVYLIPDQVPANAETTPLCQMVITDLKEIIEII